MKKCDGSSFALARKVVILTSILTAWRTLVGQDDLVRSETVDSIKQDRCLNLRGLQAFRRTRLWTREAF